MGLLTERGHDVELVVDVLEPGVTDEAITEHAEETGRVVLTADDDFLSIGTPTLFQVDDRMEAHEIAEIVDAIADQLTQTQVETYRQVKLVDDWL